MIGIQTISVLLEEPGVGLTLLPRATRQLQYYGPVLNEHGITRGIPFFLKKKKGKPSSPHAIIYIVSLRLALRRSFS